MIGFALRRDMAFEWNGGKFRIQQLNEHGQALLLREVDGALQLVESKQLLSAFSAGELRRCELQIDGHKIDTKLFGRPLSDLKPYVQHEVRRRLHYLQYLGQHGTPCFMPSYLKLQIAEAAVEIGDTSPPCPTSIYRWWRRLTASGDPRSLIPRFDRRGRRGFRQSEDVLVWFKEAVEEAFLLSPGADGGDVYTRWCAKIKHANHLRTQFDQIRLPSRRTCYRFLSKVEMYDRICLKDGQNMASRKLGIVMARAATANILERVEADHTPLDLFVIDDKTLLPLGRPILTVYLDTYSRMPLGYHLNFSGTSADAVLSGLRHAILPKEPAAPVIPGLLVEHTWPCYGVMDCLVLDNGLEFHGNDLDAVALDLGLGLFFCPKRTPWFKGSVERYLGTLNYCFAHHLPGTSFARMADRKDYDPQKHAALTLAELVHVLEKWILDVYAQSFHRGLGTTPWAKWQEGLSRRVLTLPPDRQLLQRRIGKTVERSLRKPGIELHGLRYNGPALQPVLNRYGEGVEVRVVFDAADLGSIQVWAPDASDPVEVAALDVSYAKGLTLQQHKLIRRLALEDGRAAVDEDALHEAKMQLADCVATLMASRKQRDRRRAAAIHGKTSTNPKRELLPEKALQAASVARVPKPSGRPIPTASPRLKEALP
ncbi:Mu transposase C-terminal domain-containing protein [Chitinimonas naiadis]